MLFAKKARHGYKIPMTIIVSALCLTSASNSKSTAISRAEDKIEYTLKENEFNTEFKNGCRIETSTKDASIIIKKLDVENNEIWVKEIDSKDNYLIQHIVPVKEDGFIIITKYMNEESNSSEKYESSATNGSEETLFKYDSNIYHLLAFDMDGNLLIEEDVIEFSEDYLFKFIKDVFFIQDESESDNSGDLSQEDLYQKALELLSIAEKTLLEGDINKAKSIIDKIVDDSKREELLDKLNIISNKSIEEELNNPFFDKSELLDANPLTGTSYINLSVDTNNITFDYLNVSTDTVLNRAVTLDVSSSLPYDINVILEGEITSNTNPTNLNKNVFSVKESNSSNFITFDDTGIVTILSNQSPGDFISHGIDIRLNTSTNIIRDVYRAVFKIEAVTK